MAEVTILPDGLTRSAGNWQTGALTDIDEGISAADGNLLQTDTDGEGETFTLDFASPGLSDSDTISQVDIVVRHIDGTDTDSDIAVELLIGGTTQGTVTPAHASSLTNDTLNTAGWNTDWTQSQLDGLQVRITATQGGKAVADQWGIDAVEVVITYTAGGPTTVQQAASIVAAASLTANGVLAGPLRINNAVGFNEQWPTAEQPAEGELGDVDGSVSYNTSTPGSGQAAAVLAAGGTNGIDGPWVTDGVTDGGDLRIVMAGVKWTGTTSVTSIFLRIRDDGADTKADVRLRSDDTISFHDTAGGILATSSATTSGTRFVVTVVWGEDGRWWFYIDDTLVNSGTGADFSGANAFGSSASHVRFINTRTDGVSLEFDFCTIQSGATSQNDRLNIATVVDSFQPGKASATPDFTRTGTAGGTNLTAGTWDDVGDSPVDESAGNIAQYTTDSTAENGAVAFDDSNAGGLGPGPRNAGVGSTIHAVKYHLRALQSAAGNTHELIYGKADDGASTATVSQRSVSLTTSYDDYFVLIEGDDANAPSNTQWAVMGFGKSGDSTSDLSVADMWVHVLHTPGSATTQQSADITATASMGARGFAIRQQSADITAAASVGARSTNVHFARAAIKPAASMGARAFAIRQESATITAVASMGARGAKVSRGRAAIAAVARMGARGFGITRRAAAITSALTVNARATNIHFARAGISAAARMGARATIAGVISQAADIAALASLTAVGLRIVPRAAGITSALSLGSRSTNIHFARAAIKSTASMVAVGLRVVPRLAAINAAASMGARSLRIVPRNAGISAIAAVGARSTNTHFARAGINATATLLVTASTGAVPAVAQRRKSFPLLLNINSLIQR